jgi:hypothetical protein
MSDPAYIIGRSRGAIRLEGERDPLDDKKVDRILVRYLKRKEKKD